MECLRKIRWSELLPAATPISPAAALISAAALLASCQVSAIHAEPSPVDVYKEDPVAVSRGGAIFRSVCSGYCHQTTPTTGDALFLFDCSWKHGGSDQEIFQTITTGVPDTRMIGFADNLPEGYADTWRIIAWLRTRSHCDDLNP